MPLVLSVLQGHAFSADESRTYLLDPGPWARFFTAIGLFVLSERQVEEQLRSKLSQSALAPLLGPVSLGRAARHVSDALRRRDSIAAEVVCLVAALAVSLTAYSRLAGLDRSSWAVQTSPAGNSLPLAGWWTLLVSGPMFTFLLLRGLWRHLVWSLMLPKIATLAI